MAAPTIRYARSAGIKFLIIDPIRASSAAVDQGPREIRPLAAFLRLFMRETGAVALISHHDTKPVVGKPDDRAKPQRASGGGIFSIADAPIHVERIGVDSKAIVTPSHYKFSMPPEPFVISLKADDSKKPTWVRLEGESTTAGDAIQLALHEKVLTYLTEHPGTSGSKVATGIHAGKGPTLTALEDLHVPRPHRLPHTWTGEALARRLNGDHSMTSSMVPEPARTGTGIGSTAYRAEPYPEPEPVSGDGDMSNCNPQIERSEAAPMIAGQGVPAHNAPETCGLWTGVRDDVRADPRQSNSWRMASQRSAASRNVIPSPSGSFLARRRASRHSSKRSHR